MAQRLISAVVTRANGDPWAGGVVDFAIIDDTWTLTPDASYPTHTVRAVADIDGALTVTLAGGLDVDWRVTMPDGETFPIRVDDGATTTLEALRDVYPEGG